MPRLRNAVLFAIAGMSGLVAACTVKVGTELDQTGPRVRAARLTIGEQPVTSMCCGVTPEQQGTAAFRTNTVVPVRAEFLLASGLPDPTITAQSHQMSVVFIPGDAATFAPSDTSGLTGTVVATRATSITLWVTLHKASSGAPEWGPYRMFVEALPRVGGVRR